MNRALHPFRITLAILALLIQVGAGTASACASSACDMAPPPAGTISVDCCCEGGCEGLANAETAALASEVSVHTSATTAQVLLHILPPASMPRTPISVHEGSASPQHLFQLYQSYRL
jgi:hypothetical protein